jgi:hypothetical protein
LLAGLWWIVQRTRVGVAMRAVSFNERAAALMGVNINRIISFTFGLGSALAAVAGIFYHARSRASSRLMGVQPGLRAFTAAVVGGIGNLPGAALGGILLGLLETFAGGVPFLSNYRDGISFAILILILLFKPAGLLGKARWKKYDAHGTKRWLLAALAAAFVVSYFSPHFNRYYLGVAIDVGIADHHGREPQLDQRAHRPIQPGPRGFHGGGRIHRRQVDAGDLQRHVPSQPCLRRIDGRHRRFDRRRAFLALAGRLPGHRHLGFRRNYSRRFQNSQAFGAATGLTGIPRLTTLFWVWGRRR